MKLRLETALEKPERPDAVEVMTSRCQKCGATRTAAGPFGACTDDRRRECIREVAAWLAKVDQEIEDWEEAQFQAVEAAGDEERQFLERLRGKVANLPKEESDAQAKKG